MKWIVLDIRCGNQGYGISRTLQSIAQSLLKLSIDKSFKLIFVNDSLKKPDYLPIDANYIYYHEYFPLCRKLPPSVWATKVWNQLSLELKEPFLWLSLDNTDVPRLSPQKAGFIQTIQWIHDTLPLDFPKDHSFLFRNHFFLTLKSNLEKGVPIVTVSEFSKNSLIKHFPTLKSSITVVPNGIDPQFGSEPRYPKLKRQSLRQELIQKHAIPETFLFHKWILGVGRKALYKNWGIGSQIVQSITDKTPSVFIHIGNHKENQLLNNTLLLPFMEDSSLYDFYQASDVLLHPSLGEGYGLVPVEAALTGLPVIYQKNTVLDEHFLSYPSQKRDLFWKSSANLEDSLQKLHLLLTDPKHLSFLSSLEKQSLRSQMTELNGKDLFDFKNNIEVFLDKILQPS